MENYDPNKEFPYLICLDVNSISRWIVKNYDKNNNEGCILQVDVDYPKEFQKVHLNLPFLKLCA